MGILQSWVPETPGSTPQFQPHLLWALRIFVLGLDLDFLSAEKSVVVNVLLHVEPNSVLPWEPWLGYVS